MVAAGTGVFHIAAGVQAGYYGSANLKVKFRPLIVIFYLIMPIVSSSHVIFE